MPTILSSDTSPLSELAIRSTPTPEQVNDLLESMKAALKGAHALDYYTRMEHNHDMRFSWWPGQSLDGRKWPADDTRRRRTMPGNEPTDVFPWPGASDVRVRLIDTVIRERSNFKRLALQRRQERIGPRDLSPDDDPQAKAALWGQVLNYFEDITRRNFRTATAQWSSIAEEYGHAVLFAGWHVDAEVIPKELSIEEVVVAINQAALQLAEQSIAEQHVQSGGAPEETPSLTPEERDAIMQSAATRLEDMRADETQTQAFANILKGIDPSMPQKEATRLAKELRYGQTAKYYAIDAKGECPEWRALTPFIDVFYPAVTTRLQEAPWICMLEWVTKSELKSRVETHDYDSTWVDAVIAAGPGKSIDLSGLSIDKHDWLLSCGSVRCGVRSTDPLARSDQDLFQILHLYYRATALENARALYHTVLHGKVTDKYAAHECCPYAHGNYPFFEHLTEIDAPYLLASRGAGELTDTLQDNVKVQVDMQTDNASLAISPPMRVPWVQHGGRVEWRPGLQIPTRSAAGMGMYDPIKIGSDAGASVQVLTMIVDLFNEFWARGPKVDPEVKLAARQIMVSDFLEDVRAGRLCSFQLIQEFSPDQLRAAFIAGLPVDMRATREEIQGMVSLDIEFDMQDLDTESTKEFLESVQLLKQMDSQNLLNTEPMLRALTARLLPTHYKGLVANSQERAKQETEDEQAIAAKILSGTQFDESDSYKPGDHATRKAVLEAIFGLRTDDKGAPMGQMVPLGKDGQLTRAQRLFSEDPDVQARILNRFAFHAVQMQQRENAVIGRVGVSPVTQES